MSKVLGAVTRGKKLSEIGELPTEAVTAWDNQGFEHPLEGYHKTIKWMLLPRVSMADVFSINLRTSFSPLKPHAVLQVPMQISPNNGGTITVAGEEFFYDSKYFPSDSLWAVNVSLSFTPSSEPMNLQLVRTYSTWDTIRLPPEDLGFYVPVVITWTGTALYGKNLPVVAKRYA